MGDFTTHLKSAAWTGAEVGAVIVGGIAATEILDHRKIFKDVLAKNPGWVVGGREGADFMIRHWGAIKAGGACLAATYVQNPWLKLFLMGIAVQGGLEELRVLTWDKNKQDYRYSMQGVDYTGAAGDAAALDAELKKLSEQYRIHGVDYTGASEDIPQADRYNSAVAGNDIPQAERYNSAVAGMDDEEMGKAFDLNGSDDTQAF